MMPLAQPTLASEHLHRRRNPVALVRSRRVDRRGSRLHRLRALFAERALPQATRSDKGVPLRQPNAPFNLSKLTVRWPRLGIEIERIKPGHPQQNGRHERMHLTLEQEATRPPGINSLQQDRFDPFRNSTPSGRTRRPP